MKNPFKTPDLSALIDVLFGFILGYAFMLGFIMKMPTTGCLVFLLVLLLTLLSAILVRCLKPPYHDKYSRYMSIFILTGLLTFLIANCIICFRMTHQSWNHPHPDGRPPTIPGMPEIPIMSTNSGMVTFSPEWITNRWSHWK